MKRIFSIALLALFFSVGVFAQTASAVQINIENVHSDTLYVAFSYYDTNEGDWRTRGWYSVGANNIRSVTFNNTGKEIYIHSSMGKNKWGKGDTTRYVIKEAFDYLGSSSRCPYGTNRRTVNFTKYTINKNGVVNYKPTISK